MENFQRTKKKNRCKYILSLRLLGKLYEMVAGGKKRLRMDCLCRLIFTRVRVTCVNKIEVKYEGRAYTSLTLKVERGSTFTFTKMKKRSSQWTRFMQLRKEAWKKFRTSKGFEPVTSRYRCDALPTELWSHWRWEQVILIVRPSIHWLYFTWALKIYVCTHVKNTQQCKFTLTNYDPELYSITTHSNQQMYFQRPTS